jgi:UDP-glucose 4-epimerase
MNVLVVGGAGYIGSHVALEFMDRGHQVTVFDNLSSGTKENLFENGKFVLGDICNPDDLKSLFATEKFDGVIHLAAIKHVGLSMTNPQLYSTNNITGTLNLLNAMCEAKVDNFVFSSSASIFGEPQYLPIDEHHPKDPQSYYGFTKLEIERFLGWYDKLKGIKYASLRYFNASGYDTKGRVTGLETITTNLLPVVMEVAVGKRDHLDVYGDDYDTPDGSCIRDYIHVTDLADAHVTSMEKLLADKSSMRFNMGTAIGMSVLEMLKLSREITGCEIPAKIVARRPGDPSNLVASSENITKILGWKPQFSDVKTIIESTWNVYNI